MTYDPQRHHRHSIRLRHYQYDSAGFYCVTICTQQRQTMFGLIENGVIELNEVGNLVHAEWVALEQRFPSVGLDDFVIMPNHLHGIICLNLHNELALGHVVPSLGTVVGAFKSLSARAVDKLTDGSSRMWQRNYYEQIIRTEAMLNGLRQYILDNPRCWSDDPENCLIP